MVVLLGVGVPQWAYRPTDRPIHVQRVLEGTPSPNSGVSFTSVPFRPTSEIASCSRLLLSLREPEVLFLIVEESHV